MVVLIKTTLRMILTNEIQSWGGWCWYLGNHRSASSSTAKSMWYEVRAEYWDGRGELLAVVVGEHRPNSEKGRNTALDRGKIGALSMIGYGCGCVTDIGCSWCWFLGQIGCGCWWICCRTIFGLWLLLNFLLAFYGEGSQGCGLPFSVRWLHYDCCCKSMRDLERVVRSGCGALSICGAVVHPV